MADSTPPATEQRGAAGADAPRPARGKRKGRLLLRLLRRSHMYAGLFMLPWAIVFGATGLLFDHPVSGAPPATRPIRTLPIVTRVEDTPPVVTPAIVDTLNRIVRSPHLGAPYRYVSGLRPHAYDGVSFRAAVRDSVWTVSYAVGMKQIWTQLLSPSAPLPLGLRLRNAMERLHTSHGYPGSPDDELPGRPALATAWAIGVDAIAMMLVFWGLSGYAMWWSKPSERGAGLAAIAASAVLAALLFVAMHRR